MNSKTQQIDLRILTLDEIDGIAGAMGATNAHIQQLPGPKIPPTTGPTTGPTYPIDPPGPIVA